ncbi:MAG: hypothetical protein AAB597_00590 [Patescibacteria group bacterium]
MNITARQMEGSSAVAVSKSAIILPEPGMVFALFPKEGGGARYFDNPAMSVRAFHFPEAKLRLIFESQRVRLEDTGNRQPAESQLGETLCATIKTLFPQTRNNFNRHGFNYDINFRYDNVIPQNNIIGTFLPPKLQGAVTHFGWQFTIGKNKGRRRETYFCKVVSPIEMQVLANIEIDEELGEEKTAGERFRKCYTEAADTIAAITFD